MGSTAKPGHRGLVARRQVLAGSRQSTYSKRDECTAGRRQLNDAPATDRGPPSVDRRTQSDRLPGSLLRAGGVSYRALNHPPAGTRTVAL